MATDIFYNGKFIGEADDSEKFVQQLREKRRAGQFPLELGIKYDKIIGAVYLTTDSCRVLRPLIVVKNGESSLKQEHIEALSRNELNWNDMVSLGIIEYVDAAEEDNLFVAMTKEETTKEHTHLEIDPITIFGVITSLVPYGNHDQSSRLNRGSKTQKQALGLYSANYLNLMDTDVSMLHYPQKPIVRSFVYDTVNFYPAGQNVTVAVMPYNAYNISDAVVLNKGSIDRGLGRSTYFKPYLSSELHYTGNLKDKICIPTKDVRGYRTENSYRYLEEDGIIYPEAELEEGDVIIGKVSPPKFLLEMEEISMARSVKENSVAVRQGEQGTVDSVIITTNNEGHRIVQVRVRDLRIPELGDKFSTAHGQKGVVGMIVPEEDIPFSSRGIRPDIIFNPHGIPSRMTVGYLLEMMAGKVGSLSGKIMDGTAFSGQGIEELEKQLFELGFRQDGKETFHDGITGRQLEAKIYVGNMYYLRLKYMVANKIQMRASGKITLLTRQPVEGRAKGGALRLGEMEKDALVAHGASLLLKERFSSDNVIVYICPECGSFGIKDKLRKRDICLICGSSKLEPIEISYASKLLIEELISLHLLPHLILKNKYEN